MSTLLCVFNCCIFKIALLFLICYYYRMNKEIYYKYFESNILPSMYKHEEYRIKTLRKIILSSVVMFILGVLFAALFIYFSLKNNNLILLLLPFFLFFMYLFFIKSIINVIYEGKKYQKWLVETVLPYFFEPVANFKFWPKNNDIESLINSQLFENFDTHQDVSAVFGIYKNTNIIVSNTMLTLPVRGATISNLFKGTIIQLELPKKIDNHIILMSKNSRKVNHYKQVNPHINELNKYLYMFAKNSNKIEVVSENLWNILKRFGELYTAKRFLFSLNKNVLIIGIEQKRPWEFGFIFKSLLKAKNYDDLIERFIVIYDLVDLLDNI